MKILIVFVLIFFSCGYNQHKYISKGKYANALDTTKNLINWYDFYVKSSSKKKIELIEIDNPVDIGNKSYFEFQDVVDYYKKNYTSKELDDFIKVNQERTLLLNRTLEIRNTLYLVEPKSAPENFKKESIEQNYLFYYYNKSLCYFGNDILSNVACVEKLEKTILIDLYSANSSIENLIFSNHYNSRENDSTLVPEGMKKLVSEALRRSESSLSATNYEKVKHFSISYEKSNTTLWVRTAGSTIYISPFIVRAAFLYTINNDVKNAFDYFYSRKDNLESLLKGQRTIADIRDVNNIIINRFMRSFYFILGHELAHVYLENRSSDILTEKLCDCYSYKNLENKNLGVYTTVLQSAIQNGYAGLWGVTSVGDFQQRFSYLKTLESDISNMNCK